MNTGIGSISTLNLTDDANISLNTLRMKMELNEGFRCRLKNVRELCNLLKQSVKATDVDVREALDAFAEKLDKKQRDFFAAEGIEFSPSVGTAKDLSYRGSPTGGKGDSNKTVSTDASVKKPSGRMYRGQPV